MPGPDGSSAAPWSLFRRLPHLFLLLCLTCPLPARGDSPLPDTESGPGRYHIALSIGRNTLDLYERTPDQGLVLRRSYRVGSALRALKTVPLGDGRVTAVTFAPWWYPTPYSRRVFRERGIELPAAVPPGHPLNYMGPFKISLSHRTSKGAIYRIHGNNNPGRVGRRVTGGCFVMDNTEGLELARTIAVGTTVTISAE